MIDLLPLLLIPILLYAMWRNEDLRYRDGIWYYITSMFFLDICLFHVWLPIWCGISLALWPVYSHFFEHEDPLVVRARGIRREQRTAAKEQARLAEAYRKAVTGHLRRSE